MALSYSSTFTLNSGFSIDAAIPVDIRMVVDTVDDLITIPKPFAGLFVNIKGTSDIYVLTKGGLGAKKLENWKKVGGDSVSKIGALIADTKSDLLGSIDSPFIGMIAVVKSESAMYVLADADNTSESNWLKIAAGSSVQNVITTDGTTPESGTGISISTENTVFEQEVYADSENGFESGKYYTSRGIDSNSENGGTSLAGINYITLSNGGTSYIRLFSSSNDNWIELHIDDDTLGFTKSDISYIDTTASDNVVSQMTGDDLVLAKGSLISFGNTKVDFTGLKEKRYGDPGDYVFNRSGSTYEDLDIYMVETIPDVYVHADGVKTRVLTECDKTEIVNMIESKSEPQTITDDAVKSLFDGVDNPGTLE